MDDIVKSAGVESVMEYPIGVEARKRVNPHGHEVFNIINHERTEKEVNLPWTAHEHLTGSDVHKLKLESYGVAVLTLVEKEGNK